ncbi:MAG TPA: tRNA threonylcarbamoyladenosine dehydratase [Saprospiraceae bacterium]|jgi:tRNA A37 threonylcarbamoyladenosine dehydratase|nr:tRNA threonylcarbamoyladenosine dehydratase [Saprospiraceae bacterium]MBK7699949.1 tRNA threonylcarbamoyladenosine dehydratase [Saprospiraceae bacterium]MBK8825584.1 tRNA threonylcarbamoyladenosine dehydratase [Saprospiraceae bacterium]MBK8886226.1 tRNA threonylcarbamoyladenosine dehydratase [Saprospiraceae bacterium]MBP9056170.1 tRNA threonylcarbamoyladenosine dehydratase [Saprospiraceae bacterium]
METPRWLERTALLIGDESVNKLSQANILLVGLGGVGSYAGEFIVRAGVGKITIIDGDIVDPTNINRQMQATHSTIGLSKSALLKQRFLDINPNLQLTAYDKFMEPEDMEKLFLDQEFDFVMDCIDSVTPKLTLLNTAVKSKSKIISAMGAGGKLDPSKIKISDIANTKECKFAHVVRKRLKAIGVKKGIISVYSEEIQPKSALQLTDGKNYKRSFYGTISYMPALFGLTMASEVIRRLGELK